MIIFKAGDFSITCSLLSSLLTLKITLSRYVKLIFYKFDKSQAIQRIILTVLGQLYKKIRFRLVSRSTNARFLDKGSISIILTASLFKQNRDYGNSAQIEKTKKTMSYIMPITNLAKYEPDERTLNNQLDIPNCIMLLNVKIVHITYRRTCWTFIFRVTNSHLATICESEK